MKKVIVNEDNPCLLRINEKCINCGKCLDTCNKTNDFGGKDCINCGQCILTCPSGALVPKNTYKQILNYINDTDYTVVCYTAPAVRVAIGDEFGYEPGEFLEGKLVSALRKIGFDYVFDTTFGADLTIMEEANELVTRLKNGKTPMFTSCCPAWVLFMNKYHKEDLKYLSTCKSPIAMQGELIKTYFADMYELDKNKIIAVSINPCIAKKYEQTLYPETDISITTKELALMIKELEIDFNNLKDDEYDSLLGKGSGGGLIFGASGGVMESTLRTAYYMINRSKAPDRFYKMENVRGEKDIKEATVIMGMKNLKIAVVSKISVVKDNYEKLKKYDFIEVMACPGGCIGGGGQPITSIKDIESIRAKRIDSMYQNDKKRKVRESYLNPAIQDAYISYISKNDIKLHTK